MLRPGVTARVTAVVAALAAAAAAGCGGEDAAAPPDRGGEAAARPIRGVTSAACSAVHSGGVRRPDRLIVASAPLQGGLRSEALQMSQAIDLVLEQRRFRAGRWSIGYQVCDDSTAGSDLSDPKRCAANGRAFARTKQVVGIVGPYLSLCAASMLPVVNRESGGELGAISASATYIGLTHSGAGVAPGDPDRYYPTGRRNFVRVAVADDVQGAANAIMAERLGVRRPYVLSDGSLYGDGVATTFRRTAAARDLEIAGVRTWDPKRSRYLALAAAVRDSGADGVYLAGLLYANGARVIRDLRARLGDDVPLLAPDGFGPPSALVQRAGADAEGMTISKPDIPREILTPAGRRFHDAIDRRLGKPPCCHTMYAAQAAEVLLEAIAASDGTRRSVTRALFARRVRGGLIGSFGFDANGDTTLRRILIHRIVRGELTFVTAITPPGQARGR